MFEVPYTHKQVDARDYTGAVAASLSRSLAARIAAGRPVVEKNVIG